MNDMMYNGLKSLRTADNCQKGSLLNTDLSEMNTDIKTDIINIKGRSVVASIEHVLSPIQCNEIVDNSKRTNFSSMLEKYNKRQRNNSRMLILDEKLAANLWETIQPEIATLLNENDLPLQPLGFDVSRGKWMLYGLNEAFRINKYSSKRNEFFSVHKDAQYCPNGDRRSLFTLLVYLNDNFSGGTTKFFFPKKSESEIFRDCIGKDITIQDEIKSLGGLEEGYDAFKVEPSVGKAVIFSQNILHESIPVTKKTKYILKTDIVVRRYDKSYGFTVDPTEKVDYWLCLNHFREAQSLELDGEKEEAGELYERALSIRYCYPMSIELEEFDSQNTSDYINDNYFLPNDLWHCVFSFLSGNDIENVVKAFPDLHLTQKAWEINRYRRDEKSCENCPAFIPFVDNQHGICTKFRFKDLSFFSENEEGCIRVAAMYAFYLLGHRPDDQFYTVRYNPETQEVCAVALKSLLTDVFLNRPCFGSVYAVRQQNSTAKDVTEDFTTSVDRTYMTLRHGAQFVGVSLADNFKVNVKWLGVSDKAVAEYIRKASDDLDFSSSEESYDSDESRKICDQIDKNIVLDSLKDGQVGSNYEPHKPSCSKGQSLSGDTNDGTDDEQIFDGYEHLRNKILEVTRENIMKGEKSQNEFICLYDSEVTNLSSVPVVIKDVILYKALQSAIRLHSDDESSGEVSMPIWSDDYVAENTTTHYTSSSEEVKFDNSSAEYLFWKKMIESCQKMPGVSAAIVTDIKKHTRVEENTMCFCYWPDGDGYDKLYKSNYPKCYNHLVFDFFTHQIAVSKETDISDNAKRGCHEDCIFASVFDEKFFELKLENLMDVFEYKVDIAPILNDAADFNHASCNCTVPAFEIEECHNIQDYPVLNHIHVVGGLKMETHEVLMWTFYGGIAAL